MTMHAPEHLVVQGPEQERISLTHWSWAMVPLFFAVWFLLGLLAYATLGLFGLHEGDLTLMAHSWSAWLFDLTCWLAMAAAPVAGITLAVKAIRRHAHVSAWVALVVNAGLSLFLAYQVFDEIRMSYWPG